MQRKPWYKSLTIWSGIITVLISAYIEIDVQVFADALPNIPPAILGGLAGLGIYGRRRATTEIK